MKSMKIHKDSLTLGLEGKRRKKFLYHREQWLWSAWNSKKFILWKKATYQARFQCGWNIPSIKMDGREVSYAAGEASALCCENVLYNLLLLNLLENIVIDMSSFDCSHCSLWNFQTHIVIVINAISLITSPSESHIRAKKQHILYVGGGSVFVTGWTHL